MKYPHIAARLFNTPLLVHPQKLDAIIAGMGMRVTGEELLVNVKAGAAEARALPPEMFSTRRGERSDRGYRVVDGVAVLSINGGLVHKSRFLMADSSTLWGYNDLSADLEDAMGNSEIHAVLQVYDSPGGEVQGAFEYADRVYGLRGKKPLRAIADGMAASAAYLGASAAEELLITTTGYAGSVGVVMRHADFSRALANEGVSITHIFAGAHKVDGNPFEPLPKAVQAAFEAEITGIWDEFLGAVAKHRGLEIDAIRATQAATYRGSAAVSARLADRLSTTDQQITELAALRARFYPVGQAARATANDKGASMSGTTQPAAPTAATFSQTDLDTARAEGHQAGVTAERERTSAILGHEKAAGNPAMAIQCISAGLTAEQSAGFLSASAPAAPVATQPASELGKHMATLNPGVTGVEGAAPDADDMQIAAAGWSRAFKRT